MCVSQRERERVRGVGGMLWISSGREKKLVLGGNEIEIEVGVIRVVEGIHI